MKFGIHYRCLLGLSLTLAMAMAGLPLPGNSQDKTPLPAAPAAGVCADGYEPAQVFYSLADQALAAMRQRAEGLNIQGAAVVAFVPGTNTTSWISKMVVVGHLTSPSAATNDPGSNLLGIAYAKAAEMAATLKPSGSKVRPPMKGELGWQGGWIESGKNGWLLAAFSGGRSEDDVKVSKAGLAVLVEGM